MSLIKVNALSSTNSELLNRSVCSNFELALANSDGSITSVDCYDSYNDAKSASDSNSNDNTIILEKVSGSTKVIYAKYGLVYLDRGTDVLTYIYSKANLSTSITYMNNSGYYGGTDAALLEFNYGNKAIKIRISGVTGWISNGTYTIIPYTWVNSLSYYKISDNNIRHYYAKNIENSGYSMGSSILGPKVDYLNVGNFYSYDGIYFYDNVLTMLKDYTIYTYENSVNYASPYYNYYLYLPHRSKTNYTVDDLDTYIRNNLGFTGSIYGKMLVNNYSTLYGMGEYFLNGEQLYGANAISMFSLSMNESAKGRSSIAINKNNIFGHNAVDGSAYSSATGYLDVRSSIYSHAYGYINYGYSEVADSRYHGGNFGNKDRGMNVMYASDVYWGEKAASYYYSFDLNNGMEDYDYYQLGLSTGAQVNIRVNPSTSSTIASNLLYTNLPVIILEEVEGEEVNGSNIWYKIQSDSNLNSTKTGIVGANSSTWPNYNWDSTGYVHSSYIKKINDVKKEDGTYNQIINTDDISKTYTTYASKTSYTPKVGQVGDNDINYYYSSTLLNVKGSIKAHSLLTILEELVEGDNKRYLVITNYSTYQKHWINADDVVVVNKDLLGIILNDSSAFVSLYDNVNGNKVASIYSNNYLSIIDKIASNDELWLKVEYQVESSIKYGYLNTNTSNITYTLDYVNRSPLINANDKTIVINTEYDLLVDIEGTDEEDGNITDSITIKENNIDITKLGIYTVVYSLIDSNGSEVTKTINVTVQNYEEKDPLFMYNDVVYKENNTFVVSGFLGIKGMNNINVKQNIIFVNNLTKEEKVYPLTKWEDYPYEMSSLDDNQAYNYSGAWFKSEIDLSKDNLPNGDYAIYVEVMNGLYKSRTLFTNIGYMNMERRVKTDNRGYYLEVDYSTLNSPLLLSVRDNLISYDIPSTFDPMFNFFTNLSIENDNLLIKGTSHSNGVDFSIDKEVTRTIIFEETTSFTRYTFDLGSITNGDYPITLAVPDNCDKTRAWYYKAIDISSIPGGNYAIYIANTVDNVTYYGELIDIGYTNFTNINTNRYVFNRNSGNRLRLELKVL